MIYISSDNGQASCKEHIDRWGYKTQLGFEPIEDSDIECEICNYDKRREAENVKRKLNGSGY